jgi:hypothetical protein
MSIIQFHLAQVNIGRIKGVTINDPVMAEFVAQLDEINQLAEQSEGFVWRLKDDQNNATHFNPFNDERVIVNLSVWESIAHLEKFVYKSPHFEVLKRRKDWFEKFGKPFMALWYVPAGHHPTMEETIEKLTLLQNIGPTQEAFSFREKFGPPATTESTVPAPGPIDTMYPYSGSSKSL